MYLFTKKINDLKNIKIMYEYFQQLLIVFIIIAFIIGFFEKSSLCHMSAIIVSFTSFILFLMSIFINNILALLIYFGLSIIWYYMTRNRYRIYLIYQLFK